MKARYISQRFTSIMLLIFGVTSLAILSAQFLRLPPIDGKTLESYFNAGKTPLLDLIRDFWRRSALHGFHERVFGVKPCFHRAVCLTPFSFVEINSRFK